MTSGVDGFAGVMDRLPCPSVSRDALRFIRAAREDPELRARVRALDPFTPLSAVVEVARAAGFDIDEEQLRAAHRADWGLRLARYAPPASA